MDSTTTVTLQRIHNHGPYLYAHYDGFCHSGVAQKTLDDASGIHITKDGKFLKI